MTRHARNIATIIAIAFAILAAVFVSRTRRHGAATPPAAGTALRGGQMTVSIRTEPRTFNRYAARDQTTEILSMLTQARLMRVNRATQEVEPSLVGTWSRSADGLRYTLHLRPNVAFSDGHPFTSDDVAFSFEAAYDPKASGPLTDALMVGGKPLRVSTPDSLTVELEFPSPFGPGLRILDNLPIVPRHKLEQALKAGAFPEAWNIATPPSEIVGLGPFVPVEYVPGQRLSLARNEHYWRRDDKGAPLPYLDRITLEVIPDQDVEMLRLLSGQTDMSQSEIRPDDYAPMKRAADEGRVKMLDLGVALDADTFWFNLKPGGLGADPRAAWLQKEEFRRAVSMAVDREAFADTVYLGAGVPVFGPVTPANRKWYSDQVPRTPHDPAGAKQLLASVGLADRNGDGLLDDLRGQSVRFTLITQKGNTALERGAAVIHEDLKKIGVTMDVVTLDVSAAAQRFLSGKYDAVYFHIIATDTDPAINLEFWLSSGSAHVWSLGQKTPATVWERQIDELMGRQAASTDERERKQLFDDVQRIVAEHLPVLYFVAPRVYLVTSSRITNTTPAVQRPQLLWSADTLAVVH